MKKIKNVSRICALALPIGLLAAQVASAQVRPIPEGQHIPVPDAPDNHFPTQPHTGRYTQHLDQMYLLKFAKDPRRQTDAFDIAVEAGDGFFDNLFLADDVFGVGANVGQGQRFTRVPRADLKGPGEWANHFPPRATGPNAASCIECHTQVRHDGSGAAGVNAIRDPLHTGNPAFFINRNTPHLFGQGALQLLAEEMTAELHRILDSAKADVCGGARARPQVSHAHRHLVTKGIDYGWITVSYRSSNPNPGCHVDYSKLQGIDTDLVVKPFQWKGSVAFIRDFCRGASYNEIGIEATEVVGDDVDGDGDGVANEASIGDMTGLAVYVADQPRPTTKLELASWGKITPVSQAEKDSIARGQKLFAKVGCADCHTPVLKLRNPVYSEPSQSPYYRDAVFPAGQDPVARGLDPAHPITFDLTKDVVANAPVFNKDRKGWTIVELYSDLKRHDLGPEDAESIDEAGTGASVFLTRPLWGVGSTAPFMHDGRATTIEQAIDSHGGEAADSRAKFRALPPEKQKDVVNSLMNLRVWKEVDIDS